MAKAPTKAALPDTSSDQAADAKPKEVPWRANLNMQLICRDCKEYPPNLIEEFSNGDMVCGTCGLVLGDRIVDTRSEWRTFSNDDQASDDPSRVGEAANPLLNGSQLQTTIAFSNSGGRSLDLHRTQAKSTADKGNKYLSEAYKVIMTFCDVLSIPSQGAVDAKGLFKMVADAGAFKNKSQDAIIAGCIFISCRQNSFPRTFREIYALTKVSKKEIGRIFKGLEKFFAAQNQKKVASGEAMPGKPFKATTSTHAKELCTRYCSQLGLSQTASTVSQDLAEKMSTIGSLAGRSPLSAAAACIFMASYLTGSGKTAKEISAVAGVSDGTIRTAYKLLYAEREKLVDPKWAAEGKGDIKLLPPV